MFLAFSVEIIQMDPVITGWWSLPFVILEIGLALIQSGLATLFYRIDRKHFLDKETYIPINSD